MLNVRQDTEITESVRAPIWVNIIFFAVTTLIALIGTPLYLYHYDLTTFDWILLGFYMVTSGLGITVGYHRFFSHRTFKANPVFEFLALFFGASAFEQSALRWSSQHRDHHRFVDTDKDPYDIKKGFFYAHIGWLMFWRHPINFDNVQDLQKRKMVVHQDRYYFLWAVGSGILVPVAIGSLFGHALAALIFAVCLRLTIVYHATFCINSVCHMFGKATYDIYSTAKDHWFVAFLTYGEGYHNFHHRFPGDYRNAIRWYQWDPSKWLIFLLSKIGLAYDVRKVSEFRILEAKLAAENQKACDCLHEQIGDQQLAWARQTLEQHYATLRQHLFAWEKAVKEHHALLCQQWTTKSEELRQMASEQLATARMRFDEARRQWQSFHLDELGLVL